MKLKIHERREEDDHDLYVACNSKDYNPTYRYLICCVRTKEAENRVPFCVITSDEGLTASAISQDLEKDIVPILRM
ncbi:hypothetical protein M0802_006705 [Mischocyttarus mexicanus]|nr:hypothetical protein M0802_006705 [Mischocyttarus mexicanus]